MIAQNSRSSCHHLPSVRLIVCHHTWPESYHLAIYLFIVCVRVPLCHSVDVIGKLTAVDFLPQPYGSQGLKSVRGGKCLYSMNHFASPMSFYNLNSFSLTLRSTWTTLTRSGFKNLKSNQIKKTRLSFSMKKSSQDGNLAHTTLN